MDPDSYYAGQYVTASARGLNVLPVRQLHSNPTPRPTLTPTPTPTPTPNPNPNQVRQLNASVDSREAVAVHLAEARHRARMLRALLGVAKVIWLGVTWLG